MYQVSFFICSRFVHLCTCLMYFWVPIVDKQEFLVYDYKFIHIFEAPIKPCICMIYIVVTNLPSLWQASLIATCKFVYSCVRCKFPLEEMFTICYRMD